MTDQLTIPVPEAGPARPVAIPPGAVRCWVRADVDEDDPFESHWATEAEALAAVLEGGKVKQLPDVCVVAACIRCRTKLEGEYGGTLHCANWDDAENIAQCDGWKIGTRGEFTCPECQGRR